MDSDPNPAAGILGFFIILQTIAAVVMLLGGVYLLYCLGRAASGLDRLAGAVEEWVRLQTPRPPTGYVPGQNPPAVRPVAPPSVGPPHAAESSPPPVGYSPAGPAQQSIRVQTSAPLPPHPAGYANAPVSLLNTPAEPPRVEGIPDAQGTARVEEPRPEGPPPAWPPPPPGH
jgi:hypothetical protein